MTARRSRPRPRLVAGVAATVALLAAAAIWGLAHDPAAGENSRREQVLQFPGSPGGSPAGSPAPPAATARFAGSGGEAVRDDADPKKSGCADDPAAIVELDRVQVNTLNENLLGVAVLRHAPGCHASWGRFEPSARLTYLSGPVRVTITAHRPATGTIGTAFSAAFDGQPVFGNILLDTAGCVEITVRVDAPDGGGEATTRCGR